MFPRTRLGFIQEHVNIFQAKLLTTLLTFAGEFYVILSEEYITTISTSAIQCQFYKLTELT